MTPSQTVHVLIADNHELLRSGLAAFLQMCPDFALVGEARTGAEAVERCEQVCPDVVVMDMTPEMGGITATRLIRQKFPDTKVIALSTVVDDKMVMAALEAGAISYLLKNVSVDGLASAVRAAQAGKATLAPEVAQVLVSAAHRPHIPLTPLSRREREVLGLMARGQSNAEIANQLTIGISTVKKHVSNIFAKLQTSNRAEAAALAVRHHLVDE